MRSRCPEIRSRVAHRKPTGRPISPRLCGPISDDAGYTINGSSPVTLANPTGGGDALDADLDSTTNSEFSTLAFPPHPRPQRRQTWSIAGSDGAGGGGGLAIGAVTGPSTPVTVTEQPAGQLNIGDEAGSDGTAEMGALTIEQTSDQGNAPQGVVLFDENVNATDRTAASSTSRSPAPERT